MTVRVLILFAFIMACKAARFSDGFKAVNQGVSIEIVCVRTTPRMREEGRCEWIVKWTSKKKATLVEISITQAGFGFPIVFKSVPGPLTTPLDVHNPMFDVPLESVSQIDFILFKGTQEIGQATFK